VTVATVVDLRGSHAKVAPEPTGQVIVLDDATSLVSHAELYLSLLGDPGVDQVICVAIGEAHQDNPLDGVALTVPPALRDEAVLWVGDVNGLDWAPGTAPRRRTRPTDTVSELITVLDVAKVFTWVWQAAREMPGGAASPGILLAFGPVDPVALADAGATAVRSLCTPNQPASRALQETAIRLDAEHDPQRVSFHDPLDRAATEARKRLLRVGDLVTRLAGWYDPAEQLRAADALSTELTRAGQAAENYRRLVAELLNRMHGHLQNRLPPAEQVRELGAPEPVPARGAEVAAGLRELVDARLDAGVALPTLAEELRTTAAYTKPQGVGSALNQLRRIDPLRLELVPFPRWPLPPAVLPLILLTCFATVFLPGPRSDGLALGALLAVVWFGAGWLLLAARPETSGRHGFGSSLGPAAGTYGLAGVLGVVAGAAAVEFFPDAVQVPYPVVLFAGLAVLAVVAAAVSWRGAVRRWRDRLSLTHVNTVVESLAEMATRATLVEWMPMPRRRLVAAAATAAATETEVMKEGLGEVGDGLFTHLPEYGVRPAPGSAAQPTPPELLAIIRGDLVRLCHETLDPLWATVETGSLSEIRDHDRLKHLVAEYDAGLTARGLMWTPDGAGSASRTALMERVLAGVPDVRQTLRITAADEMRQLSDSRQLSYLSGSAPPAFVRFGPEQLRRVLADRSLLDDPGVLWTDDSELIGALRLVPLRAESVRRGWGEF